MENKNYKRQYRELDDATRERISRSMKGRHFSALHKSRLSASLKKYWETIPNRPKSGITMNDLIGAN